MTHHKPIIERFPPSHLKIQSKEWLVNYITDIYRELDNIIEALQYIENDIDLVKKGQGYRVHDNP